MAHVTQPIIADRLDGQGRLRGLYAQTGKRVLDVTLVLAAAPLILPIVAVAWALVRLDGGRGFFRQPRVGRNGQIFDCWKLRTMVTDADTRLAAMIARDGALAAEWAAYQKLRIDPRITFIGRILRATSLDELPQLWNVLLGDMSLVGPRPFMVEQEGTYRRAGGQCYFRLRPGITGPWQISGRGRTMFTDRIQFDSDYLRNVSFGKDIQLIARTVLVVLKCAGR